MEEILPATLAELAPLELETVLNEGAKIRVIPEDHELAALSSDLALDGISSFRATIDIASLEDRQRTLNGKIELEASVTQSCVVSLEPVQEGIRRAFELVFELDGVEDGGSFEEEDLAEGTTRITEVIDGEKLDVKPLLLEALALCINPYPRSPSAAPDLPSSAYIRYDDGDGKHGSATVRDEENRPFSNLKDLLRSKH